MNSAKSTTIFLFLCSIIISLFSCVFDEDDKKDCHINSNDNATEYGRDSVNTDMEELRENSNLEADDFVDSIRTEHPGIGELNETYNENCPD